TGAMAQELDEIVKGLSLSWWDAYHAIQEYNQELLDVKLEQFQKDLDATDKRLAKNSAIMDIYGENTKEYNDAVADSIKAFSDKESIYKDEEEFLKEQIMLRKEQGKSYDDLTEKLTDNTL